MLAWGPTAIDRPAIADATNEQWNKLLGVNLWGPIYLCRALVPHMRQADRSDIVMISSIAAQALNPGIGLDFIEGFYNPRRRHSAISRRSSSSVRRQPEPELDEQCPLRLAGGPGPPLRLLVRPLVDVACIEQAPSQGLLGKVGADGTRHAPLQQELLVALPVLKVNEAALPVAHRLPEHAGRRERREPPPLHVGVDLVPRSAA